MSPRAFAFAASLAALSAAALAGPALSQDVDGVIATNAGVTAPPMTTDQKIANILSAARAADEAGEADTIGPRQIHGTAGVSVGTGGYRAASVSALIPVGENGMVGVAYAQSQGGRGFGYGRGPGFGPGGRLGGRDGQSQSLGMSFSFDAARDDLNCRDGRPVAEPTWAGERSRPACEARAD